MGESCSQMSSHLAWKSILDSVADQAKDLQRKVGARDRNRLDQYFSSVRDLEQRMANSGAMRTFCRYDGVHHAFFNQARPEVYDRTSAELAWERTVSFLKDAL